MKDTQPIFVVGSGRCGTRTVARLLASCPGIEAHHEYSSDHGEGHTTSVVQRTATLGVMGLVRAGWVRDELKIVHGTAIHWTDQPVWVDCSKDLCPLIHELTEVFPTAKFVHLVRDGRKVAGSFYRKLAGKIYPDRGVQVLQEWLADRSLPMPPPENRYWGRIPVEGQPFFKEFPTWDRFQRCCFHWVEHNRFCLEALANVPEERKTFVWLEQVTGLSTKHGKEHLADLLEFFGIDYAERYWQMIQRPSHVVVPEDAPLTAEQRRQFDAIGRDMMVRLGYDPEAPEYEVQYG